MKISVIIPVFNAEKYIKKAVESALEQKETGEVLLIEDESLDNSLNVCKELKKHFSNVHLLRHRIHKNLGAGACRNLGIKHAKFEYISFLDADDFYLPDRFGLASKILKKNKYIDGVYEAVGIYFNDQASKKKWISMGRKQLNTLPKSINQERLFEAIFKKKQGFLHLNGILVKKSIFERCGYFFENLKLHQDTALFIQLSLFGKLTAGRLNYPVAMRRIHGQNRILKPINFFESRLILWKTVFNWAKRRKLKYSRLQILFQYYFLSFINIIKKCNNYNNLNRTLLQSIARELLKQPLLIVLTIFRLFILKN